MAWSGDDRPGGVVLFVVGMRPKICGGNRAKVMSTDTVLVLIDTALFALPFIGGVVLAVPCRGPQNKMVVSYYGARGVA